LKSMELTVLSCCKVQLVCLVLPTCLRRGLPRADQRCLGCSNAVPLTCLCWIVCCTTRSLRAADLGCGLVPAPGPSASCSSLGGWRAAARWEDGESLGSEREPDCFVRRLAETKSCCWPAHHDACSVWRLHAQCTPRTPDTLHTKKQSKNTNHARTALQR
jgi:hypothetical protein